jgi:hypothetical protein
MAKKCINIYFLFLVSNKFIILNINYILFNLPLISNCHFTICRLISCSNMLITFLSRLRVTITLYHFLHHICLHGLQMFHYWLLKKENRICKFCDLKEVEDEFHFFFRCKNNHTLINILYKDINGICPKFNEYDRAKRLQSILSSSQIMRFTVPFVKKSIALRKVGSTAA